MLTRYLGLIVTLLPSIWASAQSNVVELDASNFGDVIGKDKPALVEFYAPWCGHCKNLAPTYEKVADHFAKLNAPVIIAKVDADGAGRELGQRYGVTGFPTLKWFHAGSVDEVEPYEGGRTLEDIIENVTEKMTGKKKAPPKLATTSLDVDNFNQVVMDENKDVLVAFTAPWCGHCKALKPVYEKVAQAFEPESNCVVAQFDADAAPNKPIASQYEINSFPDLKLFPKGSKEKTPLKYSGDRSESDLVRFLNEHCGTHRAVGGGLNEFAGRVATLDTLAAELFAALPTARAALYQDAVAAAKSVEDKGKYYLKVMQKIIDSSEDYVEKESKRLRGMLAKKSVAPSKVEEITTKLNILAAFVKQKAEDVVQAVREEL